MPKIAEIKEIDGELWVRVGKPGDFPSGIALWTPDEQEQAKAALRADLKAVTEALKNLRPEIEKITPGHQFLIVHADEALARPGVKEILDV